jgi:hypothetical protein
VVLETSKRKINTLSVHFDECDYVGVFLL